MNETKLVLKDYKVNYHGTLIDISVLSGKIYSLFVRGGGYFDSSVCYYDLYEPNRKDFGKTLVKIGEACDIVEGGDACCTFTINGTKTQLEGLTHDYMFLKIQKSN